MDRVAANAKGEDGSVSLTEFNALVARLEALETKQIKEERRRLLDEGNIEDAYSSKVSTVDADEPVAAKKWVESNLTASQVEELYDNFELPADTYTLLMTAPLWSISFWSGFVAPCLILALANEADNRSPGNPFGLPAGVRSSVRAAQYLGVIIGILMEDEIPQGLTIIGKGAEQQNHDGIGWCRILFPSLLRMIIGYLFICCLFLTVVQEASVLNIFFDVLALQFVESIDDILFDLFKRGFFGRSLRLATNNTHHIICSTKEHDRKIRIWFKRLIRAIYFINMIVGIAILTFATVRQRQGAYRCNSVMVDFGDAAWEKAHVTNDVEDRLLIYSHFNGIYEEEGKHGNRPRYVERNKEDGEPFKKVIPAEIVYCQDIEAWVLRHPNITTALAKGQGRENECNWLLRSPNTESYDITELADETEWNVWMNLIQDDYRISIKCNECFQDSHCNYNGICETTEKNRNEGRCRCFSNYFGLFCQHEQPCNAIRTEKDKNITLELLEDPDDPQGEDFVENYGRPMYVMRNLSGKPYNLLRLGYPEDGKEYFNITYPNQIGNVTPHKHYHDSFFEDDDFFKMKNSTGEFSELLQNYTFVLRFTGQRWYGEIIRPGLTAEGFEEEEYHAFWDNAFSGLGGQDNTFLISAPAVSYGSPVGPDFFEMRRRSIVSESGHYDNDYGPYGVLIPLTEYEGSGWFHCKIDNN